MEYYYITVNSEGLLELQPQPERYIDLQMTPEYQQQQRQIQMGQHQTTATSPEYPVIITQQYMQQASPPPCSSQPGTTTAYLQEPTHFGDHEMLATNQAQQQQPTTIQNAAIIHRQWLPQTSPPISSSSLSSSSDESISRGKTTKPLKRKRIRTAFSSYHVDELEKEFKNSQYMQRYRRFELARRLELQEKQIKIWFQNRRMRDKREGKVQPVENAAKLLKNKEYLQSELVSRFMSNTQPLNSNTANAVESVIQPHCGIQAQPLLASTVQPQQQLLYQPGIRSQTESQLMLQHQHQPQAKPQNTEQSLFETQPQPQFQFKMESQHLFPPTPPPEQADPTIEEIEKLFEDPSAIPNEVAELLVNLTQSDQLTTYHVKEELAEPSLSSGESAQLVQNVLSQATTTQEPNPNGITDITNELLRAYEEVILAKELTSAEPIYTISLGELISPQDQQTFNEIVLVDDKLKVEPSIATVPSNPMTF